MYKDVGVRRIEIDTSLPIVFMHIPKCAGTALRSFVASQLGARAIRHVRDDRHGREIIAGPRNGLEAPFTLGHFGYDYICKCLQPSTKITFLRDPLERTLSHYYYWRELAENRAEPALAKKLDLLDFLNTRVRSVTVQLDNMQAWMLIDDYRPWARYKYRGLGENAMFDLACSHLDRFDFIGFTEQFDEDLRTLSSIYGWPIPQPPRVVNKTQYRKGAREIGGREMDRILELTRIDRRIYEYARGIQLSYAAKSAGRDTTV